MPSLKSKPRKAQMPQQTTFIEPGPQVKNSDILDVDEAAILPNVAQKESVQRSFIPSPAAQSLQASRDAGLSGGALVIS